VIGKVVHSVYEMLFPNLIRPRNKILTYEAKNFIPQPLFYLRGNPALRETPFGKHWSEGMNLFHGNILLQEILFALSDSCWNMR
jgi:hypothetical protein